MGVDQDGQHTKRLIVFDEADASHICSKIIHDVGAGKRLITRAPLLKVKAQVLDFGKQLMPLIQRFDIDRTKFFAALMKQIRDQVATDKSAASANDDSTSIHCCF